MNTKRLMAVAKAIVEHPRQFAMSSWHMDVDSTGRRAGGCGTAACIAGWAHHLFAAKKPTLEGSRSFWRGSIGAVEVLRLDWGQTQRLFLEENWPETFRRRYHVANTAKGRARVAAARIEHFIKTKGKE